MDLLIVELTKTIINIEMFEADVINVSRLIFEDFGSFIRLHIKVYIGYLIVHHLLFLH